jgi:hypothetical protein
VSRQAERRQCKMCNRHWRPRASNSLARRLIGLVYEFLPVDDASGYSDSDKKTSKAAFFFNNIYLLIIFVNIRELILPKSDSFLLLFSPALAIPENPMQNVRPADLASAADHLSPVSAVINRALAIAPAPLLPGEQETDYAEVAVRIVKAAPPRDAIEVLLRRDVIDLSWEVLRLR